MHSNFRTTACAVALLTALGFCTGCADAVIVSSSYLAGIEISPAENGQQSAKVALQKFEGVSMPGCKEPGGGSSWSAPCKEVLPQAYSVLAVSYLETGTLLLGGLTSVKIKQVFATGKAAATPKSTEAVVNTFTAIETQYAPDPRSGCISAWLNADTDGSRHQLLSDWWKRQGHTSNAYFLIPTAEYAADRKQFVSDNNINCP